MGKKKSASVLISALGVLMGIFSALISAVHKQGGTDEDIYRLVTPEGEGLLERIAEIIVLAGRSATNCFSSLLVDFEMSLEELVKLGNYDWCNDNITSRNFPTERVGKVKVNVELLHFGRDISSEEALEEMDKMGYRAAEAHELLAFGAKYPDVQRTFSIVALGSVWHDPDGRREVVCLGRFDTRRVAGLDWLGVGWFGYWRFAAVRK